MASFIETLQREPCGGQSQRVICGVSGDIQDKMPGQELTVPNSRASHTVYPRGPQRLDRRNGAIWEIL